MNGHACQLRPSLPPYHDLPHAKTLIGWRMGGVCKLHTEFDASLCIVGLDSLFIPRDHAMTKMAPKSSRGMTSRTTAAQAANVGVRWWKRLPLTRSQIKKHTSYSTS